MVVFVGNLSPTLGNPRTEEESLPPRRGVFAKLNGREGVTRERRQLLEEKLRRITGLPELEFEKDGTLRLNVCDTSNGSKTARMLIDKAVAGNKTIVIEDVSRRPEVVFARVVAGPEMPQKSALYLIQIDFVDFDFIIGDRPALSAFDVGWAFLHELDHLIEASEDSTTLEDVGDCETHINKMREECNLPLRAEYFHTFLPGSANSEFISKFVRLSFVQKSANKQKRYWVMWDADVVGGLDEHRPSLSLTKSRAGR
jgi:hypothetical protein